MTAHRCSLVTLGAVLVVLFATTLARATNHRCADGRWLIDDGPLTIGPFAISVVGLSHGVPAVDAPCRAVRSSLHRIEDTTRLRALFVCVTPTHKRLPLRLRARIVDACEHMLGGFAIRPLGQVVRFTATLGGDGCASNAECADDAYCAKPLGECDARGTCEPRPQGCPDNVDPVCGCDRTTYSNACDAAAAGVSLAHEGECREVCGGIAGIPCGDGEFCELPAGECDSTDLEGQCVEIADACPEFYSPVCGCDGVTYANDCFRQQARVQKDHEGRCGGCTSVLDCLPNEFCQSPDGRCGAAGECTFIEQGCSDEYDPVCGCDGETYANRCRAAMHAVSIAHAGTCEEACGGIAGIPCPDGEFCELPEGECHWADLQGRCLEIPPACPLDIYAPVCGCDGVTYATDCERQQAGVQKAHDGKCDCVPACCLPGTEPFDSNADGCPDSCKTPGCPIICGDDGCQEVCPGRCETTCDCYATRDNSFCYECPLLCPNCGSYWQCKDGACVEECGAIPPDVTSCFVDRTR